MKVNFFISTKEIDGGHEAHRDNVISINLLSTEQECKYCTNKQEKAKYCLILKCLRDDIVVGSEVECIVCEPCISDLLGFIRWGGLKRKIDSGV